MKIPRHYNSLEKKLYAGFRLLFPYERKTKKEMCNEYYWRNRTSILAKRDAAYYRQYRATHKEQIKANTQKYQHIHKDQLNAWRRNYRKKQKANFSEGGGI